MTSYYSTSTAGKRSIVQPVDIDTLASQRFQTHTCLTKLQVTIYTVRLSSNHSRGAHLCIIYLQDAPTQLLAEELHKFTLIRGPPVLRLTLQLGPCIQIYVPSNSFKCVCESKHSPVSNWQLF